jgi:hypothetical protein
MRRVPKSGPESPQCREQQKQVALGDAELDVLALRRHRPALRRDDLFLTKGVGAVENAAAVDPEPEIGRHREIGRGRHDAFGRSTAPISTGLLPTARIASSSSSMSGPPKSPTSKSNARRHLFRFGLCSAAA